MPTGKQIRAARQLVEWSADDLAERVGITKESILNIERGDKRARSLTMDKIVFVFEEAGIQFTENEGIRRKPIDIETFEGTQRFDEFYDYLYQHLLLKGGDVCIYVVDEGLFSKYRGDPDLHRRRMKELVEGGKVTCRILAAKSSFKSEYAQFKRLPESMPSPASFYVFGDCLAMISFSHEPAPYVVLHKSGPFAEAYKQTFNLIWESVENP